jgi:hypothetical protein
MYNHQPLLGFVKHLFYIGCILQYKLIDNDNKATIRTDPMAV